MATISGNLSTGNVNQTNRIYDFTPEIFLTYPDQAPFTALLTAMRSMKSSDSTFKWFNKGQRSDETLIDNAAGYAAGATDLVVDDASIYIPGDIIRVIDETDSTYTEQMQVTAVTVATETITVTRGVAGTTAVALVDNQKLATVGNAFAEFSDIPASSSEKAVGYDNNCQIFKVVHEASRSFLHTDFHSGGEELKKRRMEKTNTFRRMVENNLIWGEKGIVGENTNSPLRYAGGLQYFINQAIANGIDNTESVSSGILTTAKFNTFLGNKGFAYGSKEKWALCSIDTINVIQDLYDEKVRLGNFETSFGLNITRIESSNGTLNLVRHDAFNKGIYANAMMIFDPNNLQIKHVGPKMTEFTSDIGVETLDGGVDLWMGELGLQVAVPESSALLYNINSAG